MEQLIPILVFFIGIFVGIALSLPLILIRKKESDRLKGEFKDTFSTLSLEALQKNTDHFLKLAHETLGQKANLASNELENKKALIDKTLENVEEQIKEIQKTLHTTDKNQTNSLNLLIQQLEFSKQSTEKLQDTASRLHEVLASTKKRGEWGERMADDVLRLIGFQEGINYTKQASQAASDSALSRPDFTFFLPQDLKLNMDVKFPFDNYLKYLESDSETDRASFKREFLKDVRSRIKEVTSRDYINRETVDYCLVFIPNEQIYAFIQSEDSKLLDEALRNRVVLASPITLYAVLALIRQAVDNFNLGRTNKEILENLLQFRKQWAAFLTALQKLGKKIDDTQKEFGTLWTTRKNQLEKPLNKIEGLKAQVDAEPAVKAALEIKNLSEAEAVEVLDEDGSTEN